MWAQSQTDRQTDRHQIWADSVKAMDQNTTRFLYLKNKFPRTRDAKIKEGIFVGPQIRQLIIRDVKFED